MILATVLLIPLAGRIYAAVMLRTGSAVKLREALRLARAHRSAVEDFCRKFPLAVALLP